MKFTVPAGWGSAYQVVGVRFDLLSAAGGAFDLKLYDSDGSTVLQSRSFDTDQLAQNTNVGMTELYFDEASLSELTPGTAYRVTILPTSGNHSTIYMEADAAADWDAWPGGGQNVLWTERTDAWTDRATRRFVGELILADLTGSGGGGSNVGLRIPTIGR
jgi:hypothetical protein